MSVNIYLDAIFILCYRQYLWLKVQLYLISLGLYMKLRELLLPVRNVHMSHIIWKMCISVKNWKMMVTWYVHCMWWCFLYTSPSCMSSTEIYRISRDVKCHLFSFLNLIIRYNFLKTFNKLTTSYKTVWQDIACSPSKVIQGYFVIIRIHVKPDKPLCFLNVIKKRKTHLMDWHERWWLIQVSVLEVDFLDHTDSAKCLSRQYR